MFWGRIADSDWGGRRHVLLIGLISCSFYFAYYSFSHLWDVLIHSTAVSYFGFGLSKTFAEAVAWQVLGVALSNNIAVTRCVVAERHTDKRSAHFPGPHGQIVDDCLLG